MQSFAESFPTKLLLAPSPGQSTQEIKPKRAKSAPRPEYITLLISPVLQIFANHYLRCHLYFPQGETKA